MQELNEKFKSLDTLLFESFKIYCIFVTVWVFNSVYQSLNILNLDGQNATLENLGSVISKDWYALVLPEAVLCGIIITIYLAVLVTLKLKYKSVERKFVKFPINWAILALALALSYTIGANLAQFLILKNFY